MNFVNTNPIDSGSAVPGGSRPWLNFYPKEVPASLNYPDVPVSELLESAARRFPERTGCTLYGQPTTFVDLAAQSRRLAGALNRLGVGPGKRVAILLPNIPEYLVSLQAVWLTGATALQLSPLMVPEEIEKWLHISDCHLVITLDLLAALVAGGLKNGGPLEHVVLASLTGHMPAWKGWLYWIERIRRKGPILLRDSNHVHLLDHLLRTPERPLQPAIVPAVDVAVLAPTGGTTGSPKAVMLTHRNLVANALQLKYWSLSPEGAESVLGVLPFFHAYGLSVCVLSSLARGATIHLYPRFEPRAVLEILEREKVGLMPAVPAILNALNKRLKQRPRDLSFVHAVMSGASPLSNAVREEFESYGAKNVVEGYGLSEASPVTHCNPLDGNARPGTIGVPFPDTEAKIMVEATGTEELSIGEVGELIVRGPQVMKGYFNNPQETAAVLRDGWLYTGDIARRDADGFFTIVDRKKDIIKTSGFLVFPAEVEEVLARHPGIAEAAVVGEPDQERGEVIVAYVISRNGALNLPDLRHYCDLHLGKAKRPHRIEVVKNLPKNFLGKIQRRKIREAHRQSVPAAN